MQSFEFVVKAAAGLHARVSGSLMRLVKSFQSDVIVEAGELSSNLHRALEVMNLSIRCGDRIKVTVNGPDEAVACDEIRQFLEENL